MTYTHVITKLIFVGMIFSSAFNISSFLRNISLCMVYSLFKLNRQQIKLTLLFPVIIRCFPDVTISVTIVPETQVAFHETQSHYATFLLKNLFLLLARSCLLTLWPHI